MKTGLDEITAVLNPLDGRGWATVKGDSGRLLKVWEAKENNPAAAVVAAQITDLLGELSMEAPASVAAPAPVLIVEDHIQHVHPFGYHRTPIATRPVPTDEVSSIASSESSDSSDSESVASSVKLVSISAAAPIPVEAEEVEATDDEATVNRLDEQSVAASAAEDEESEKASTASIHEVESEDEDEGEDEGDEEPPAEEEEEEAKQVKIDGKMYWLEKATQTLYEVADGDEVGDEVGKMVDGAPVFNTSEEEDDVVEPADDEEEEEEESGMNVEQVMIRGRAYWLEVDTKKLYAVVGDDDLGDEIGEMVNGKPHFYAK